MLTPEEELELKQLEEEQEKLTSDFNSIKEELSPKPKADTGFFEAGARGIAQGLTFNTADEIAALAESTLTGKSYDQALKESRAEYEAAEKEYPITTALGELGGGVAQGVGLAAVTGGAGAAGSAASTASKLGKLGQLAKTALIPSTSKSALANIGSAALSGATYGALSEIGASEKEGLGRLEEVPMAGLTGAVVGGGLGGLVEGGKKGYKAIDKFVTNQIEKGNVPYSIRKIRDLWRAGKEGQGYITEASKKSLDKTVQGISEDATDLIQNNLDDVRNLKQTLLASVDQPIQVMSTYDSLKNKLGDLAKQNLSDSSMALKRIDGIFEKAGLNEVGEISAKSTDDIARKIENYILDNPESSTEVKSVLKDAINELKINLRLSVKEEDVLNTLKENSGLRSLYEKFVSKIDDALLENSDVLTPYEKKFFAGLKRSIKAKGKKGIPSESLEDALKEADKKPRGRKAKPFEEKPIKSKKEAEDIEDIIAQAKGMLKQKSMTNPLGRLDAIMHNILNASESLGGITRMDGDTLKRKFKVFDVLNRMSTDTQAGEKAVMRYEQALDQLNKASPELKKQFEKVTTPALNIIENKKFLKGGTLSEGTRDPAIANLIPTTAGAISNVLGQAVASKATGGVVRPTLTLLKSLQNKINTQLVVDPDNKLLKRVSQGLNDAIVAKDEVRRAAILNTLMQYESIRKLFKENE